ncbi:Zn(II)2Cys6 transcription factor domain-containing protein PWA37_004549 [Arxiozyma heterogenica]|uniref:Zn(II)2Cys6 transcription factor domain-containing protein n=1 Tax=Arxiozyma heterogenica TaxID=278026 RepID=UPI002EEB403A
MDIRGRKMRRPPACVQCRKRKIGCDRSKPMCGNCRRSNYPTCFYPDIPGKYIQSHSSGKLQTDPINTSHTSLSSFHNTTPVSNNIIFNPISNSSTDNINFNSTTTTTNNNHNNHNNQNLSLFQQFTDYYNTGLNLSSNKNQLPAGSDYSTNPSKLNKSQINTSLLHVIPRATQLPNLGKNPVGTALDSNITLHWVQGPAILDYMNSQYLSKDIIDKEMKFLRTRLLELQDITGKIVEGIDLITSSNTNNNSTTTTTNNNNNNNTTTTMQNDKRIEPFYSPISESINTDISTKNLNTVDIFKDLDPQFLDPKEMFSIFDNNNININRETKKPTLQSIDTPNSIFTLPFLRNKDLYLNCFLQNLSNIFIDNKFDTTSTSTNTNTDTNTDNDTNTSGGNSGDNNGNSTHTPCLLSINDDSRIRLLHNSICLLLIKLYLDHVKETQNLIPPLNITGLLNFLNQINNEENECILDPKLLSLDQLIDIGNLSILLLLIHEMLSSSVLIIIEGEQFQAYQKLSQFIAKLVTNIYLIKHELTLRPASASVIESLQFLTLSKFYQSITLFNRSLVTNNYSVGYELIDFDEDIHHGLQLSLNHENKNDKPILLWNFICKHYLWRHIFKGEYSNLFYNKLNLNSTPIMDPLFKNDFKLLQFQNDIIQYLQSKDRVLSLYKVIGMKDLLKVKYEEQAKKCLNMASTINGNVDSIIYRNTMLYINYYLLLQHELHDDIENFTLHYKELLMLLQDTIFFIFSNLANKIFAGYEFLLQRRSFILLNSLCDTILSLYQRSSLAFQNNLSLSSSSSSKTSLDLKVREETKVHSQYWITIIRKLLILLQDYSQNCKNVNHILSNIMTKMKIIITYDMMINDINNNTSDLKKQFKKDLSGAANIFEKLNEDLLIEFNAKLKSISESLIKSEVYNNRDLYKPTHLETMGITAENYQEVFNAFKE